MVAEPRHWVLPDGIVSTAFPSTERTCNRLGIFFDPWQQDLCRAILAKDENGKYAARFAVVSICRQAGKTFTIGALAFADAIKNPGSTTIWTAHRFKVARETFDEMCSLAVSAQMAPHIERFTTGAGSETIYFKNGSRIMFAARERGTIRGLKNISRLVLDEAQILTESSMSDLSPTLNTNPNAQIVAMGTPPKPGDPSLNFETWRSDALSGHSKSIFYAEFGADPDAPVEIEAPGFWEQVENANPSFPHRTEKRAIELLRLSLINDDDFRREALGIWGVANKREPVFPAELWRSCERELMPEDLGLGAVAIASTLDLKTTTLVGAGVDGDEVWVKPLAHGEGTSWVLDRCRALCAEHGCHVVVDSRGPAALFIPLLEREEIPVRVTSTNDVTDACAGFEILVREQFLRFTFSEVLESAVEGAVKRRVRDRWAWGRQESDTDITALEAATFAAWSVANPVDDGVPAISAYEYSGVTVI